MLRKKKKKKKKRVLLEAKVYMDSYIFVAFDWSSLLLQDVYSIQQQLIQSVFILMLLLLFLPL